MSWKSTSATKPCLLLRDQAPRSKLGQDAYLSQTPQTSLCKKLTSCVALLRRFAGSGWSSGAVTLRTVTLILVYLTAECCTPAWCRSAHTRPINVVINDALWILTGCLRPTPTDNLPILVGIQPAESRRKGATFSRASSVMEPGPWAAWGTKGGEEFSERGQVLSIMPNIFQLCPTHFPRCGENFCMGHNPPCAPLQPPRTFCAPWLRVCMQPGHLFHPALNRSPGENARHLKSRHPFVSTTQQLISSYDDHNNRSAGLWEDHRWNAEWFEHTTRVRTFIPDIGTYPPGMAVPRTSWVVLNHLRTGVGSLAPA